MTFYKLTGTLAAAGDIDQTATTVVRKDVPVEIRDASGSEGTRGNQVDATASHTIRTRFDSTLTASTWGVDQRSVRYNIVSIIDEDGRQREMIITAKSQQ